MGQNAFLKLSTTTVTEGETSRQAYVVGGVEISAVGYAGSHGGEDIILTVLDDTTLAAATTAGVYLGSTYQQLFINYPAIAKEVLEVEYTVGEETVRAKMSAWAAAGSPAGTVKLPVQLAGIATDEEYDAQGAAL